MNIRFLGLDEVLALHREQIELYGGAIGVRDLGLLESAVASPEAFFGGSYLHGTLAEMASAYAFHLAQNHAFVDGNKRVAAAAMFMFLFLNGLLLECDEDDLVTIMLRVADGRCTKAELAIFIAAHTVKIKR